MANNGLQRILRAWRAFSSSLNPAAPPTSQESPSIGLALGGGFARGIAHVGILKVLEAEGIPISFVAGTSVGAMVGAAYCSGVTPAELEELATKVRFRDLARWTVSRYGFATNLRMNSFLDRILKVKTFEELRIPLAVTATDLASGDGVVFRSGPLAEAVRASCAYPGVFLPVTVKGRVLVDGMLAHSLPSLPVREMGAQRVIAVNLKSTWSNANGPRHVFDVIGQCFSIAQDMNCGQAKACADLIIEPDVTGYRYDDFEHSSELVRIGEAAARNCLLVIRKWLPAALPSAVRLPVKVGSSQPLADPAILRG